MKSKELSIVRISKDCHYKAKIAACQKLVTLQSWIEQLIEKELNETKLQKIRCLKNTP